jgi:hypothetical protein
MTNIVNDYKNTQFPDHNIDPAKKGDDWLKQGAQAAWGDCYGQAMFYHARDLYQDYRDYAYGRQSTDRYKPSMGVDQTQDASMWNVTWGIRPVLSKYMDIITSIMMNVGRKAIATPIDSLAEDQADKYFADVRAKILMRDALMKTNPELANSPALMTNPGEPSNMKELEMQEKYGFKFNMAMEAEQGIELVQYQNNLPVKRNQVCKDIVHLGVGGYKDWLDESGKPLFRDCDPARVIMSNCQKADFSDKLYVGEIIEPSIAEVSQYFNDEEIKEIQQAANYGTVYDSNRVNSKNDKLKIAVLDLEILTWNDLVYSRMVNDDGNEVYKRRPYENITNPERVKELSNIEDADEPMGFKSKYFSKKVECWYKIKWIVGTEYCYDCGKVDNQKRPKGARHTSESSYHFHAVNFNNMTAQGMVERMKDIVDEYQLTIYKIQDFKNKWLPYIMEIDLDALEAVAMGKAGTVWTPEKIMDMVFQTRALVVRKKDISGINVNYKAMEVHQTGMASELAPLMGDLTRLLQEMNDVTGLNPVTDSTGSGERKLKATALLDQQATNNALSPLMFAEKMLFESLSRGCILRLIQAVNRGQVSGVMSALGSGTVKFIRVSPDISLYDWGIKLTDLPTDDDIKTIMEQMGLAESTGLFRPQDIFIIRSIDNLKAMEEKIGYLYEERFKEQQQIESGKIQQTIDGQQKSVIVSEQAKQQTLQMEYQLKTQFELAVREKDKELLMLKLESERGNTLIQADAKDKVSEKETTAKVVAADVTGSHAQMKQLISNSRETSKAS